MPATPASVQTEDGQWFNDEAADRQHGGLVGGRERAAGGGILAGFPLSGVKIEVYDGEVQDEGSDEVAFRIAAGDAFDQGLTQAGPVLLEPVMSAMPSPGAPLPRELLTEWDESAEKPVSGSCRQHWPGG